MIACSEDGFLVFLSSPPLDGPQSGVEILCIFKVPIGNNHNLDKTNLVRH